MLINILALMAYFKKANKCRINTGFTNSGEEVCQNSELYSVISYTTIEIKLCIDAFCLISNSP